MALVRDLGITIPAIEPALFATIPEYMSTAAASTSPVVDKGYSTANYFQTSGGETTGYGRVIDRTAPPLGTLYNVVMPAVQWNSTRGSTEANRSFSVGVKLQHGDSSGGGDMADYSTANQPAVRQYFSTKRSTDGLNWEVGGRSTGPVFAVSNPAYYDLRAAKQYIRIGVLLNKNNVTTESSGDEHAHITGTLTFLAGASLPQVVDDPRSPFSSSTSTA
jgi:hypothetical protein